jgi:glutathione peroxidase
MKSLRNGWPIAGVTLAGIAAAALAWAVFEVPGRDFIVEALRPIAVVAESTDDAAGDALVPNDAGDSFLPVPSPLDDDRVIAALAPLAPLSCRRDDPEVTSSDARADALDAPLASYASPMQVAAVGPLVVAAAAPIAPVTAPAPSQRGDAAGNADMPADCPELLRHRFNRLQTGESQSLCQFKGKVLLVVNTASYCGYTGQYEGLEALYRKYKGRGLVVVGFPSNDFGGQEPGTNQEIAQFCRLTYGVQFPMFEKSSVTKVGENPLFASLSASTGVAPTWNFFKYVIDRNGQGVAGYPSRTTPSDPELVRTIERLLAEKPQG